MADNMVTANYPSGVQTFNPNSPARENLVWNPITGQMETASGAPVSGGGVPLLISGPVTITSANQSTYDGQCLEFSSAQTVTLSGAGLTLSFTVIPPASGNASIAFASGATGNGAATTITRAAAANAMFGVQCRNTASTFVVTGS